MTPRPTLLALLVSSRSVLAAVAALASLGGLALGGPPLPSLSEDDRTALSAASDGIERREESWVRLLEHASEWPRDRDSLTGAIAASPIVERPDWTAWLLDPESHRGSLVRVSGRLEQATEFPWPSGDGDDAPSLAEWFVRPEWQEGDAPTSGAIQVWVVDPPRLDPDRAPRRVEIVGRFLRVTELEGRDGVVRAFPTVVGVAAPVAATTPGWGPGTVVVALVVAMIPIVIWLRRLAKRSPPRRWLVAEFEEPNLEERRRDLPPDPAEALEVLEREAARERET